MEGQNLSKKAVLRKEILQKRDSLSKTDRLEKSHRITEGVVGLKEFQKADAILLYASYKSEVDTEEMFTVAQNTGKAIYFPKVQGSEMLFYKVENERDLFEGYRGIREPEANLEKCFVPMKYKKVCVIMPGAVFDRKGNRIGYGGGYYDKFLGTLEQEMPREDICKIGIAFSCQLVADDMICREEFDIRADYVITESGCFG